VFCCCGQPGVFCILNVLRSQQLKTPDELLLYHWHLQSSLLHMNERTRKLSTAITVSYIYVFSYTILSNSTLVVIGNFVANKKVCSRVDCFHLAKQMCLLDTVKTFVFHKTRNFFSQLSDLQFLKTNSVPWCCKL
jgi:hypothetical protein